MLNFFRKCAKLKIGFTLILALLTLNLSIDTPDSSYSKISYSNHIKENLEINDIETLYELITEVFLGMDNHIEEGDEFEYEEIFKKIHLLFFQKLTNNVFEVTELNKTKLLCKPFFIENISRKIYSPPPEVKTQLFF
jgi:hypothetical protein